MMRLLSLIAGVAMLALIWAGPLPLLAAHSFTSHMIMHVGVVALAAPLIALALTGSRLDLARRYPVLFAAIPASLLEFAVVWGWHAPMPHHFARSSLTGLWLEQASFLSVGLLLWLSCIGASGKGRGRNPAGILGLLFTSMHMTLLGALLALAPRALYGHAPDHAHAFGMSALQDQNMGGIVMLAAGGAAYMLGGLILMTNLLNGPAPQDEPRRSSERV